MVLEAKSHADFNLPHLYLAPPLGMILSEFHPDLWRQKTRVPCLCDSPFSRFGRSPTCDIRTDGQTDRRRAIVDYIPQRHTITKGMLLSRPYTTIYILKLEASVCATEVRALYGRVSCGWLRVVCAWRYGGKWAWLARRGRCRASS